MGIISLFLSFPFGLLVIGVLIYIIINMKKDQKTSNFKITSHTLLQAYLYLVSFVTLGILIIGIGLTSKALISYKFPIPFSYTLDFANKEEDFQDEEGMPYGEFQECYFGGEVMTFYERDFCFDKSIRKTELITGVSLILSMSFLFAIHQYSISKIKEEKVDLLIKKAYFFLSLVFYSFLTIVMIPFTVYSLADFFLFEPTKDMYVGPSAPAMNVTVMIILIPLWIYFFKKATALKEK